MNCFTDELDLRSGLLSMVWISSLRLVKRYAITIWIFHGLPPLWQPGDMWARSKKLMAEQINEEWTPLLYRPLHRIVESDDSSRYWPRSMLFMLRIPEGNQAQRFLRKYFITFEDINTKHLFYKNVLGIWRTMTNLEMWVRQY